MEEEKMQDKARENVQEKKKKNKKGGGRVFLHFLQHVFLITAVALSLMVLLGAYVIVETKEGTRVFDLSKEEDGISFEDSEMFNSLLGSSVSDIICYGAIRGQMETDGEFDPKKEIDITAFANRYQGGAPEEITANYYLSDLIKWGQAGFTSEEVYMTGEEVEDFLLPNSVSANLLKEETGDGESYREDLTASLLNNRYRSVEGKNIEDYTSTWDAYNVLCDNLKKTAEDLLINYNEYLKYSEYYDMPSSNVVYFIRQKTGKDVQVFTNMDTKDQTVSGLSRALKDRCSRYLYYDPHNMEFETNTLIEEATLRYIVNGFEYAYPENTQIMIGVDTAYPAADAFNQGKVEFGKYAPYTWKYLVGAIACLFLYFVLLVLLTMSEGVVRRKETGEIAIRLKKEDRMPTELMLIGGILTGVLIYLGIDGFMLIWREVEPDILMVLAVAASLLISLCFSFVYYSFVRRIKAGILWRGSLLRRLCVSIKKWVLYCYEHSQIVARVWVPFGLFVLFNLAIPVILTKIICALMGWSSSSSMKTGVMTASVVLVLLVDAVVGYFLYRSAMGRRQILEGIELIREGNLEHKVKEEGMYGDELVIARAVNSIGDSVKEAVETSMKDERLKADLITNVSHDIKTPLTSIINYVDLIKRANVQDPKVREYIEVLDVKSQRLKQLTDDLVEASKISSGNIVLQWEKINLIELLNQTIGEFSEKFEQKGLYPVLSAPSGAVYINADSRRIWRVIENLFNNIFKYALERTRVYIDLEILEEENGKRVELSVKNISAQPLKVKPEELTERFIRGDESRTTEGSGLGLSIAKNLTEIQNGSFEIIMDGDLFKVKMTFPVYQE